MFDSSYAVQVAEESKAFRISNCYPTDGRFELFDLAENR